MHRPAIECYTDADTPLHRAPAAFKLASTIFLILALLLSPPRWIIFVVVAALLIVAIIVGRISPRFVLRRMLTLELFVIGVALLMLLRPDGMHWFAIVITRTTVCLLAIVVLSATTRFSDLLNVLKVWHMPSLLVTTLALMDRYMYVLREEADRMRSARASRAFDNRRWSIWQSNATVIVQLFVRTITRAERVYDAMCARGWR